MNSLDAKTLRRIEDTARETRDAVPDVETHLLDSVDPHDAEYAIEALGKATAALCACEELLRDLIDEHDLRSCKEAAR